LASPDFTKHLAYCANGTKIALNATYDGDGAVIYEHAYTLGCEGIVSKRLGSPYCADRTDQWLKMKTRLALRRPAAVVTRCWKILASHRGG
jgi:ATP-dependent DNA ligase